MSDGPDPYFASTDVTVWNADARDAWRWLPEASVDAIVTSQFGHPPWAQDEADVLAVHDPADDDWTSEAYEGEPLPDGCWADAWNGDGYVPCGQPPTSKRWPLRHSHRRAAQGPAVTRTHVRYFSDDDDVIVDLRAAINATHEDWESRRPYVSEEANRAVTKRLNVLWAALAMLTERVPE